MDTEFANIASRLPDVQTAGRTLLQAWRTTIPTATRDAFTRLNNSTIIAIHPQPLRNTLLIETDYGTATIAPTRIRDTHALLAHHQMLACQMELDADGEPRTDTTLTLKHGRAGATKLTLTTPGAPQFVTEVDVLTAHTHTPV